MALDTADVREWSEISPDEIRTLMVHANRAGSDASLEVRLRGYLGLSITAAAVVVLSLLGMSPGVSNVALAVGVGASILSAINAWNLLAFQRAIFTSDLVLAMHTRLIETTADLSERVAEYARERDDLDDDCDDLGD